MFVTGAAGAVGSIAGQIAKLCGASRVIGSPGSRAKVRQLTEELGYDVAFDYHDGDVRDQLAQAAPEGIVVFDNVGGSQLEAAIDRLTFEKSPGAVCNGRSVRRPRCLQHPQPV